MSMRWMAGRAIHIAMAIAMAMVIAAPTPATATQAARPSVAIVQFHAGVGAAQQRATVRAAGGVVVRDLHVIRGLGVRMAPRALRRLAASPGVRAVTLNAAVRPSAASLRTTRMDWDTRPLATAFPEATRADKAWTDPNSPATGAGVTVAVLDTGIAGQLPDFRASQTDPTSRVIASVVTNPGATTATDGYGHGTHVAGLLAGNGRALPASDPLVNRYVGAAPQAKLVSVKVSDDHGNATVMDVIAGLQFVVDHGADYGIRVVNLSLASASPASYQVDPLDAAVEEVWAHGVVVVAAAGNRGTDADAVSYAPANDPYVITVGAVDDHGTKETLDDSLAAWSSRGTTQDGVVKPDIVAPGAHVAAPLAPDSDFQSMCPTCVVDQRYFKLGGTSMAAPIVAGIAADVISTHPGWTPDQVKGALTYLGTGLDATGELDSNMRLTADGQWEVAADKGNNATKRELRSNAGLVPNSLLDPVTRSIDPTRASWGRASWGMAADGLRASWGAASWSCDCASSGDGTDSTRASWGRASWGRASWGAFFGDTPAEYGELAGGPRGAKRGGGSSKDVSG
jgi:serine protease AprX